jgi:SAM-dependent methyltransferase
MSIVHYSECPVCKSSDIHPLLTVKDHSVSGEEYVIWQCGSCSLRFTQNVPAEEEIGPYYKSPDYISHTNTSKGFVNGAYQKVRNYTLQQKADLIAGKTGIKHGKILDIGCGTGAFLNTIKSKGWNAIGVEPDFDARNLAKELYGLQVEEPSALFNLPASSFDAITMWHVLEHVHDLNGYVAHLKTLLKANGFLFVAVPNYQSVDATLYGPQWAAYDVPRHLYHFSPKSIDVLMQRNGLRVIEKKQMWFDSFYISLLSSKYRFGKTKYVNAVLSGLRSNLTALVNKDRCSSLIYIIGKG